ncbi:MAG: response regulator [Promethearchaeota archaeon]
MEIKANILIVDDNNSLCKTMSFVLKRKGYTVAIANNGGEAIEKVKKEIFDIIFMDIKMPFMNGVDTYKIINGIQPETVVILMTAYAVEDLVKEALKEGVYDIIYKPLDIEKVLSIIEKVKEIKQGAFILIVDDDPGTCITLRNILVKNGHKVGIAHTGEEAFTMAKKREYNVLFIDMKLPTINGLETYLVIKKINPEIVTIIMTAYRQEMNELVQEALNNSAYTCLYKPFDLAVMLKLINKILKRRKKGK